MQERHRAHHPQSIQSAHDMSLSGDCVCALQGKPKWVPDLPLAKWVFIHPARLAQAHEWVKTHAHKEGLSQLGSRFKLSSAQIVDLQKHLGADDAGVAYLQVVYQHHGQRVYVPASCLFGSVAMCACKGAQSQCH